MSSELATVGHGNALAMTGQDDFWNDKQIAALQQLGVSGASNGDLAVFHHVCQSTGLDPFARQIYMIERQGKQTIQTGIDGFRLVARRAVDRTGETLSIGSAEWCGQDGVWRDVWLADEPPAAARVTIIRGTGTFTAVALWREYAQFKRDGNLMAMWRDRSAGQLAKCAEALGLRKAFPQDLSGVYADDEVAREERRAVTVNRHSNLGAALAAEHVDTVTGEITEVDDTLTDKTRAHMFVLFAKKGVAEADQLSGVNHINATTHTSRSQITEPEARAVIRVLEKRPDVVEAPVDAELVEEQS